MESSTVSSVEPTAHLDIINHPNSGSLSPLRSSLHDGLVAVSIFALLSFALTCILFMYTSYKLIAWRLSRRSKAKFIARNLPDPQPATDFTFEDSAFGPQGQSSKAAHDQNIQRLKEAQNRPPNQFLILVYNLLLADMHQAASFLLSVVWIQRNGIHVGTTACFVQGLFDSNGDLSSSLFITAIAIHTYLSVVKGYRPPQKGLYAVIVGIWIFVYALSAIPLLVTNNGNRVGGYYVRAGAWCWINEEYENLRLLTHYLFIFLSLATTTTLYTAIYLSLRRQARQQVGIAETASTKARLSHNPAFLIYPLIYVTCTLPLAAGRIATMAGANVPLEYFCFAGSLIASNGSFDCFLFGMTRHTIVFASKDDVDVEDTGLETFAFTRTPAGSFGNSVWIQGGSKRPQGNFGVGGWWQRLGGSGGSGMGTTHTRGRSLSQESLRGAEGNEMAIQMDVVTSVAVEIQPDKDHRIRYPEPVASARPSLCSSDAKGY